MTIGVWRRRQYDRQRPQARVTQTFALAAVAATPEARATQTFAYSAVNVAATTEGKVTQVFAYALVKP